MPKYRFNELGLLEIDLAMDVAEAKLSHQCDNCKGKIDTRKPAAPPKGMPPKPVVNIQAKFLNGNGDTQDYHFCDEECLRQFLNGRSSNKKKK